MFKNKLEKEKSLSQALKSQLIVALDSYDSTKKALSEQGILTFIHNAKKSFPQLSYFETKNLVYQTMTIAVQKLREYGYENINDVSSDVAKAIADEPVEKFSIEDRVKVYDLAFKLAEGDNEAKMYVAQKMSDELTS